MERLQYVKPYLEVIAVETEGVICKSGNELGPTETEVSDETNGMGRSNDYRRSWGDWQTGNGGDAL